MFFVNQESEKRTVLQLWFTDPQGSLPPVFVTPQGDDGGPMLHSYLSGFDVEGKSSFDVRRLGLALISAANEFDRLSKIRAGSS